MGKGKGEGLSDKAKAMLTPAAQRVAEARKAAAGRAPIVKPTPEQMRGERFKRETTDTRHGQVVSIGYRREPLFETMAKTGVIDAAGLKALRYYRNRHEETAHSLTRCALDVQTGGGGMPSCLPAGAGLDYEVRRLEAAIGAVVDTVRAVALEDQSFSEVAIARFGSRKQSWLESEKSRGRTKKGGKLAFVEKLVPKSGRHREIVRDEFLLGLGRLIKVHAQITSTAAAPASASGSTSPPSLAELTRPEGVGEVDDAHHPAVPAEFIDPKTGRMRELGEIADMIRERHIEHGDPDQEGSSSGE